MFAPLIVALAAFAAPESPLPAVVVAFVEKVQTCPAPPDGVSRIWLDLPKHRRSFWASVERNFGCTCELEPDHPWRPLDACVKQAARELGRSTADARRTFRLTIGGAEGRLHVRRIEELFKPEELIARAAPLLLDTERALTHCAGRDGFLYLRLAREGAVAGWAADVRLSEARRTCLNKILTEITLPVAEGGAVIRLSLGAGGPMPPPTAGVSGKSFGEEAVAEVIRENWPQIRQCHERVFAYRAVTGKLKATFEITHDGRVKEVVFNRPLDSDVEMCVTERLQGWRFPPPPERDAAVSYTWTFQAPRPTSP